MLTWSEVQLSLVRARMLERESEAARARLAASIDRAKDDAGLRGGFSRALTRARQAIAPEPELGNGQRRQVAARQP